ncbi:MAG: hypothetical protein RJA48_1997 [Verrucomicrobiota bacterium]
MEGVDEKGSAAAEEGPPDPEGDGERRDKVDAVFDEAERIRHCMVRFRGEGCEEGERVHGFISMAAGCGSLNSPFFL